MNKVNPILITGGAGYIGSHTVVELVKANYFPVIVDDMRNANPSAVKGIAELIGFEPEIHYIDVCDEVALEKVFQLHSFSGIIHFAAYKAVGESVELPLKYYKNNIGGLLSICELALKYKVHNFVFSSSCTVYGEPNLVKTVSEETPKSAPNSPYGNTKLIGEAILDDVQLANADFKVIKLRYFNPIGAHSTGLIGEFPLGKPSNLLPFVTQTAIGKLDCLTVFGDNYPTKDGTCIRDYIHVVDLAEAHVAAISKLENMTIPCLEAVNIGTGTGTSVLEVITTFERISNEKLNWKFGANRPGDVIEIFANAEKAKKFLNWEAKHSLEDSIKDAWNWEKKLAQNV